MTPSPQAGTAWVFGMGGFALASWMSRVPDVHEALGLTPGELGILLLAISAGSLIGLPLAGRVTQAVDAGRAVQLGFVVGIPGLVLAAAAVHAGLPFLRALLAVGVVSVAALLVLPAARPLPTASDRD